MSHLSPTALAFIPLADLLTQLENLINQIKFRLLSSDMISSSDPTISTSTPKSFPSSFPSYRVFKRCQRAKLWRSQKDSTKQTTIIPNSSSVGPSPQFFKYLKDVKTGKVKVNSAPADFNRAEGGIIHPSSISLISEESGVTCLVPSSIDNVITPDSVKSRVIESQILKKGGVTETRTKVFSTTDSCDLQPVSTVGSESNYSYLIPNRFSVLAFSDSESDDDDDDDDDDYNNTEIATITSNVVERLQMSMEITNMSFEDVSLPSHQVCHLLKLKSDAYFRSNNWCMNCGSKDHLKCDLSCVDCNVSDVHKCAHCPKFLAWFNGPDNPAIQSWYSVALSQLRKTFTGNPRSHYF